jgi:opacity protein-like surface antigen
MVSVTHIISAAAAAMVSTAAFAADMPQPLPPPMQYQPVIVQQPAGAWYLRGDIGIGITSDADLQYLQNPLNSGNFALQHASMGDTTFFGAGVGYEFNNWLRFDVTGEYRTKSALNAFGSYTNGGGGTDIDTYQGFLRSTVFLANGYIDLGTWNCLTPFIGAGVGFAYNTLDDFVDIGVPTAGSGIGRNSSSFNFAWALHAGVSYAVTQNFSVELAYRYLNYGSITDTIDCTGGCNPDSYKLQNLSSNDLMLGMRWRFPVESPPVIYAPQAATIVQQPAPVIVPQPQYQAPQPMQYPQPQYQQPQYPQPQYQPQYPLSTRG